MKFTKENFQKKYKEKETEELEEDVIGGGGDTVITHNEVSTDTQVNPTVDKSDRKKGMSKTMDKHIAQTRNPSATFGYGGEMGVAFGGRQGNMHVNGGGMNLDVNDEDIDAEEELTESSKDKMRRMVKELMDARTDSSDFVRNNNSSDVIRNKIPPIESLEAANGLQSKANDLLTILEGTDRSPEEIAIVLYHILNNLDTSGLDNNYKTIIKNAL